jgi:hypothetical protein
MENPRDMANFEWQRNTVSIYLHEQKIEKNVTWKLHIIIIKLCALLPVEFSFQHWPRTTNSKKNGAYKHYDQCSCSDGHAAHNDESTSNPEISSASQVLTIPTQFMK